MNKPRRRLEFLDGMRGLAALMVVYCHACNFGIEARPGLERSFMDLSYSNLDLGRAGVVLFFGISGFIIPVSFRSKDHPIAKFTISRFFRFYPAYWVSIGVVLLMALPGARYTWFRIAANVTMVQYLLRQPDLSLVYWTLFIEVVFYAFCIVAFLLGKLEDTIFSFVCALTFLIASLGLAECTGGRSSCGPWPRCVTGSSKSRACCWAKG